nr:putative GMP synthase [Ipomoea batatas]
MGEKEIQEIASNESLMLAEGRVRHIVDNAKCTVKASREGIRVVQQLHVELRELQTCDQQIQISQKCSSEESKGRNHQQRFGETWVPVCGPGHRLFVHASCRDDHRSPCGLL